MLDVILIGPRHLSPGFRLQLARLELEDADRDVGTGLSLRGLGFCRASRDEHDPHQRSEHQSSNTLPKSLHRITSIREWVSVGTPPPVSTTRREDLDWFPAAPNFGLRACEVPGQNHAKDQAGPPCERLNRRVGPERSAGGQGERDTDQPAQHQHASRRADSEDEDIEELSEGGGDGRQDQEHQGRASRHAVQQADEERPASPPEQVTMVVAILRAHVEMNVTVGVTAVGVGVTVEAQGT